MDWFIAVNFFYLGFNIFTSINFIFIAGHWPKYYKSMRTLLVAMSNISIKDADSKKKSFKILRWFYGFLIGSFFNYFVFLLRWFSVSTECIENHLKHSENRVELEQFGVQFFHFVYPGFFEIFPYNFAVGILLLIIDILMNFAWVINDSLIVIISFLLARSFTNINENLLLNLSVRFAKFDGTKAGLTHLLQHKSRAFWIERFEVYRLLCKRVFYTNQVFGVSICLSFSLNLFLTCMNILSCVR